MGGSSWLMFWCLIYLFLELGACRNHLNVVEGSSLSSSGSHTCTPLNILDRPWVVNHGELRRHILPSNETLCWMWVWCRTHSFGNTLLTFSNSQNYSVPCQWFSVISEAMWHINEVDLWFVICLIVLDPFWTPMISIGHIIPSFTSHDLLLYDAYYC
jgi:hypothetical protein